MPDPFRPPSSGSLKGKVVVLTGVRYSEYYIYNRHANITSPQGAIGIGADLVRLLHNASAHVFFGDVLDEPAIALEKELDSATSTVKFVHCDVTSYADNLALYDAAFEAFGRVDHAISNAGLGEQGNIISPDLTLESVREEPKNSVRPVDVNLKGPVYFARLASVYLRQASHEESVGDVNDKSLTFTSSVAAFREDPGLYVYVASKHGVMGLMRVLRRWAIEYCEAP